MLRTYGLGRCINLPEGFTGVWRTWRRDGRPGREAHYRNGRLHGRETVWHPNGNLRSILHFKNGMWHGSARFWHANGRLSEDRTHRNDQRVGVERVWDSSGRLLAEGTYRDGLRWKGTFAEGIDVRTNTMIVTSYVQGRDRYGRRHDGSMPLDPLPGLPPEEEWPEPLPLEGDT